MKEKLWQSGIWLNELVENYTVWDDYIYDMKLIPYDVQASLAHAQMLHSVWIISSQELDDLQKWLSEIQALWEKDEIVIDKSQEDCHTFIEQYLTDTYWEVWKKIHTGRSRNDQVLVMMRLFQKASVSKIESLLTQLLIAWHKKVDEVGTQSMPWYTHMQKAMPTTVWTWLGSYSDWLKDILIQIESLKKLIDQNPLGSAAGYGIGNFKWNVELTTKEMWFSKVQSNPMYAWYSRGYFEKVILENLWNAMLLFGKFATDMMQFTMSEFNYFSLRQEFTTGSSIMPQKRNYDLFEIMRGNVKRYFSYSDQIRNIIMNLWSWYHRDLQLTKKPFIDWIELLEDTIILLTEVVKCLEVNTEVLDKAMTPDLYVTEEVYEKVNAWESFRDAYMSVKNEWFKKN